MQPLIAIFGRKQDPQCMALRDAVSRQGATARILGMQLGGEHPPSASIGNGRAAWEGLGFADIRSVYVRGVAPNTLPAMPPVLNAAMFLEWRTRYVREQEYQAFTYGFFSHLRVAGKLVVNPPSTYVHHNAKGHFYECLRSGGFEVPQTLTTNDPVAAQRFVSKVGRAVVKPGIGVGSTRLVDREEDARLAEVAQCPVTFQEYVPGSTLRVHVVADTMVLALRILGEGVDSRTETQGFEYYAFPEHEAEKIVRANRFLGLHWAAWDVLASADGRYVYLDCNPGAYFMWIGEEFATAVCDRLAAYLVTFARGGSQEQAAGAVTSYRAARP